VTPSNRSGYAARFSMKEEADGSGSWPTDVMLGMQNVSRPATTTPRATCPDSRIPCAQLSYADRGLHCSRLIYAGDAGQPAGGNTVRVRSARPQKSTSKWMWCRSTCLYNVCITFAFHLLLEFMGGPQGREALAEWAFAEKACSSLLPVIRERGQVENLL
jgi:hypothetical protein